MHHYNQIFTHFNTYTCFPTQPSNSTSSLLISAPSESEQTPPEKRSTRTNPLMRLNTEDRTGGKTSPRRRTSHGSKTTTEANQSSPKKADDFDTARRPHEKEKRVSFENAVLERTEAAEKSEEEVEKKQQLEEEQEEQQAIELCDIEPISGTVFRKVTVRRRRQEMRKIPAVDTGELGWLLLVCAYSAIVVTLMLTTKVISRKGSS